MAVRQTDTPLLASDECNSAPTNPVRLDLCRRTRSLLRHGTNKTKGTGGEETSRSRHVWSSTDHSCVWLPGGTPAPPGGGADTAVVLAGDGPKNQRAEQVSSAAQWRKRAAGSGLWLAPAGTTPQTRRRQRVC